MYRSNCLVEAIRICSLLHGSSVMMFMDHGKPHFYVEYFGTYVEFHNIHELSWYDYAWHAGRVRIVNDKLSIDKYSNGVHMTIMSWLSALFYKSRYSSQLYVDPSPGSHKWTDIIDSAVWDYVFDALDEHARLVKSELYSETEYKQLCDYTGKFSCDYAGRYQWCCDHRVIEFRGRTQWSRWFHDSPVDHILTVYSPDRRVNIKGYKDGKHVLEEHRYCDDWNEYSSDVIDRYKLAEKNPTFIGRRDDLHGYNWIAEGNGVMGTATKWILEDEPIELI